MRLVSKVGLLAVLLMPMATAPAFAQSWKWDWNINGGYSVFTNMLDAEDLGTVAEDSDVKFKSGGLLGTQLTFWPSTRFGIRVNGTYADRPLEVGGETPVSPIASGISNINLWGLTGDLMIRLAQPRSEFESMEILPYLALGLGAKWTNPAGDNYTCTDDTEGDSFACAPFTAGTTDFALGEKSSLMGLAGLGADWRVARNIAIRTEIGDRIWDPRLHELEPGTGTARTLAAGDEDVGKTVHELYGQVGLSFLFGVARPVEVAIAPPPPPAPEPAPPPAPEVTREAISVCVVDPTAPGGIRMQSATLVASRDTMIMVDGTDRPLSTAIGTVSVASNADWYVRGEPLTITIGNRRAEFATYGSARIVEASDLAFLGTVNGIPVYADRNDVADVIDELDELNRTNPKDLGQILEENRELRDEIDDVKVLYVPMHATGCVFQAVQRQEDVRKGGK
jgi:hypothetical protein